MHKKTGVYLIKERRKRRRKKSTLNIDCKGERKTDYVKIQLFTVRVFFSNRMKICSSSRAGERGNWRKLVIVKPTFNLLLARDWVRARGFAHLVSILNRIFLLLYLSTLFNRTFLNCNAYFCLKGESPEKLNTYLAYSKDPPLPQSFKVKLKWCKVFKIAGCQDFIFGLDHLAGLLKGQSH